jgi:hypothetical protein
MAPVYGPNITELLRKDDLLIQKQESNHKGHEGITKGTEEVERFESRSSAEDNQISVDQRPKALLTPPG